MAKGLTADKVRNLTQEELRAQQRELSDQLFRLKFQMKMGQTESLKKIRGLRKDIARVKTILRERELGLGPTGSSAAKPAPARQAAAPAAAKAARKPAKPAAGRVAKGKTRSKTA